MTKSKNKIQIIPLGGLEGIGKNMTAFEYNDEIIIVDCGIMFPSDDMPGIDFLIPDLEYVRNNRAKIRGIFVTHGHEDHIGAIPFLLNEVRAPIYATKLTIGLIKNRIQDRTPKNKAKFIEVKGREKVTLGQFALEFIHVNHSIVDGVGLAIGTPLGTIIHTGDFKIDFTPVDGKIADMTRFSEYGEEGVLLLMSDSTNAERPGFTRSESILESKLTAIFSQSKGRIIVATFASNIHRIQQVMDVAQKFNRKVFVSGLSMQKNIEIAQELGYLKVHKDLIVNIETAQSLPDKKLAIIGTGSQGEPMSALSRMSNGTHRHFKAKAGDTVIITASVIPGNERTVNTVINALMQLGAEVHYDRDPDIHVSGHGSQDELKMMLTMTKPQFFMPIHGDYKHLKAHAQIAESLGIKPANIIVASNGDILELSKRSFKKKGHLDLKHVYVDGNDLGSLGDPVIRERKAMSTDGALFISLVISQGMLTSNPQISIAGSTMMNNPAMVKELEKVVQSSINKSLKKRLQARAVESDIKKDLQAFINKRTRRNPVIKVQALMV